MDEFHEFKTLDIEDVEPWLVSNEDANDYTEFRLRVPGEISVSYNRHSSTILHKHEFYELVLVTEGTGVHYYRGVTATLLPGEIFLIKPGEPHAYYTSQMLRIINCQFTESFLNKENREILTKLMEGDSQSGESNRDRQQLLKTLGRSNDNEQNEETVLSQQECLDKQGILQLDDEMEAKVKDLMQTIMTEQEDQRFGYEKVESACLQQVFIFALRAREERVSVSKSQMNEKEMKINQVIDYMEQHMKDKMDVDFLARMTYWSTGHFRAIFTEVTGLPPIEYLNRLRIVKSLELIKKDHMKISEAALQVGFSDPAYYSRVFKKIFGHSPRYFVDI